MSPTNTTTDDNKKSPDTDFDDQKINSNYDYSYVSTIARIAIYDDTLSAPRIIEVKPNKTAEYIGDLASNIYLNAQQLGGSIPYAAILEVTENYIHARFTEIVVSILNKGKTIRFADQGPGIKNKEKAQLPGFSSAIEPMKEYIRGVGSGLPIVKEYLNFTRGNVTIEDNISAGTVVTLNQDSENEPISYQQNSSYKSNFSIHHSSPMQDINSIQAFNPTQANQSNLQNINQLSSNPRFDTNINPNVNTNLNTSVTLPSTPITNTNVVTIPNNTTQPALSNHSELTDKEKVFMSYLLSNGPMRVTDLSELTDTAPSSTHSVLKKLENKGLITHDGNKRRMLTEYGNSVAITL
jgi:predicted transcriptional regulator